MPTIIMIFGWRLFFYLNEGNEPIHIHCTHGEKEAKYWLDVENYDIIEAFSYQVNSRDRRILRKIIFQNFDRNVQAWEERHGENE